MAYVAERSTAKKIAKSVQWTMANYMNQDGISTVSAARIAADTGWSKPAVLDAVSELETLGEVEVRRGGGGRGRISSYRFPRWEGDGKRSRPDHSSKPGNGKRPDLSAAGNGRGKVGKGKPQSGALLDEPRTDNQGARTRARQPNPTPVADTVRATLSSDQRAALEAKGILRPKAGPS